LLAALAGRIYDHALQQNANPLDRLHCPRLTEYFRAVFRQIADEMLGPLAGRRFHQAFVIWRGISEAALDSIVKMHANRIGSSNL
jgi:hypothetical protein